MMIYKKRNKQKGLKPSYIIILKNNQMQHGKKQQRNNY